MRRLLNVACAAAAVTGLAACGTENIKVASSSPMHTGAVLFAQRCSGCHTLSYAATHGSASNVRTAMQNNGPNFNVRCERPVARVLYAIENGGFSGAIMPQNIVVGQDARKVAEFVSEYAGRQAPKIVGQIACASQPIGSLPQPGQPATQAGNGGSGNQAALPGTQTPATGKAKNSAPLRTLRGPNGKPSPGPGKRRTVPAGRPKKK